MNSTPSQKPNNSEDDFAKLTTLIKDIKFSMLTTIAPDGTLQSRPMTTQNKTFDGTLWFFTGLSNSFIENLDGQREVNVSYAKPGDMEFVSVSGTASVSLDRAKMQELWSDLYKAWYPQGLNDPNLCLLRIEVSSAEYWDTPSGKVVQLLGFLKAIATGERAHPGGHGHVDLAPATPTDTRVAGFEPESTPRTPDPKADPTPNLSTKTKTAR
jgi:general stress protein 26